MNQELLRIRSFTGSRHESNRRAQEYRSSRHAGREAHRPPRGGRRPVRASNAGRIERMDRPEVVLETSPVAPPLVELGRLAGWRPLPLTVRDARRRARDLAGLVPPPAAEPPGRS